MFEFDFVAHLVRVGVGVHCKTVYDLLYVNYFDSLSRGLYTVWLCTPMSTCLAPSWSVMQNRRRRSENVDIDLSLGLIIFGA